MFFKSALETLVTTFITILLMSGAGFVIWWGIESTRRFCSNEDCCKKKPKK